MFSGTFTTRLPLTARARMLAASTAPRFSIIIKTSSVPPRPQSVGLSSLADSTNRLWQKSALPQSSTEPRSTTSDTSKSTAYPPVTCPPSNATVCHCESRFVATRQSQKRKLWGVLCTPSSNRTICSAEHPAGGRHALPNQARITVSCLMCRFHIEYSTHGGPCPEDDGLTS